MASQHDLAAGMPGSGPRLESLVRRYRKALHIFFMRRTGYRQHDCEDLTQEVFLRLAQRRCDHAIKDAAPYIFQAASNVLADHYRRSASNPIDRGEIYRHEADGREDFSAEQVILDREAVRHVMQAIDDLPERARQVFILCRFDGLKQSEIAARLGITVSAVEKHVRLGMVRVALALRSVE